MRCRLFLIPLFALAFQAATLRAAVTSTALVPPQAPLSTFVDEAGIGRDPFFPNSRRQAKVVKAVETHTDLSGVPDFVSLKGISVVKDKKLAIINNYTVAQGEEFTLRYGAQVVKVKCMEIKDTSVIVSANGASKELTLRNGFN
jgi:hypothetical protein